MIKKVGYVELKDLKHASSWALVDVHLYTHGELPPNKSDKKLDFAKALYVMATKIEDGDELPPRYSIVGFLKLAGEYINKVNEER